MPVSLRGESVLVVGASSGIGRATAVAFAQAGARVMASARRTERLEQLRAEFPAISIFTADAADRAQMDALAEATGHVGILVYATGTNRPERSMLRLTPEIWNEVVQVNLNGAYYITAAVLPAMRAAHKGHLIYVSSISGLMADISGPAYQASKHGLVALAHAIRVEEHGNGIRTCAICPGLVDTEILLKRPFVTPPEEIAKALQPEDVAEVILNVASLPARVSVPELQVLPAEL